MSGIAGCYRPDGQPVDRALLARMHERLAHRGPDGAGVWQAGPAGLAHRLLFTTPESLRERQPFPGAGGQSVITADARLDNREDLAGALGLADSGGLTDCGLILAAYEKWGTGCAARLLGDFAFAIWDAGRQQLFCARDHFGIKPLYYYHSARLFAFASEIKALFCLDEVPRRVNELRVADYLAPCLTNAAVTYFDDIFRLPAGHHMTVTAGGLRLERYWQFDPTRQAPPASDEDYGEAFREILSRAVGSRLRSAYPVGSMLSGGLDSSSVSVMARHLLEGSGQRLHTFSVTFSETPESDERSYMQSVIDGGGLEHHPVPGERLSPLDDLEQMLWHRDEPWRGAGLSVQWATYRAASAAGMRVLLSGNGGDTVIGHGAGRLSEMASRGQWLTLAGEIGQLASRSAASRRSASRWPAMWAMWWRHSLLPFVPAPLRDARRGLRRLANPDSRKSPAWAGRSLINPEFAWQIERSGGLRRWREAPPRPARTEREAHYHDLLAVSRYQDMHDRAASAWGLEQRHPLLDVRLAEFCLSLPADQKLRDGLTRVVLRQAMQGLLPELIRARPDKRWPMHGMARSLVMVHRPLLDETILGDNDMLARYVNMPMVRRRYQQMWTKGPPTPADWALIAAILHVTTLAAWLRQTSGATSWQTAAASVQAEAAML